MSSKQFFDKALPEEMRNDCRFCLWSYDEKGGKIPRFGAKPNQRETFSPYNEIVRRATPGYSKDKQGKYGLGVGLFVTDSLSLGCIDLDHCLTDGKLSPLADDVLRLTGETYTEISPSGEGLHIFFKFKDAPEGYGQRGNGIECYLAGRTNRYMTLTGRSYREDLPPVLLDLSEILPQILDKYLLKQSAPVVQESPTTAPAFHANISDVRRKMRKDFRNLYEDPDGVIAERFDGDHSKADYALCCSLATWTRCNAEQMDTLFRESPLMRDKWDERHSADGKTYGQMTVQRAIDEIQKVAKEFISEEEQDFNDFMTRIQGEAYKPYSTGMNELDDILDGGFILQTLAVLTAAPAAGKTTLAQQIFEGMGVDTIFINLEMSKDQLRAKSLSRIISESGGDMSPNDILRGYKWTAEQRAMVRSASEKFKNTVCPHMKYVRPRKNTVKHIKKLIEGYAVSYESIGKRAPIVVIDYLHLLSGGKTDDAQTIIKKAVKMLKDYAIDHNSIVFLISASNRDSNKDGKLTLESGRDSSAIEYSSDVQFALNHSKLFYAKKDKKKEIDVGELLNCDEREMVLQVLKNRMGAVGKTADLVLDAKHSRFYSPTFAEDDL